MPVIPVDLSGVVDGEPILAATTQTPFLDLQAAMEGVLEGTVDFDVLALDTPGLLQLTSTTLATSRSQHRVALPSGQVSGSIETITGGSMSRLMLLSTALSGQTITLDTSAGNIRWQNPGNFTLDDPSKMCILMWDGTYWSIMNVVHQWYDKSTFLGGLDVTSGDLITGAPQSGVSLFSGTTGAWNRLFHGDEECVIFCHLDDAAHTINITPTGASNSFLTPNSEVITMNSSRPTFMFIKVGTLWVVVQPNDPQSYKVVETSPLRLYRSSRFTFPFLLRSTGSGIMPSAMMNTLSAGRQESWHIHADGVSLVTNGAESTNDVAYWGASGTTPSASKSGSIDLTLDRPAWNFPQISTSSGFNHVSGLKHRHYLEMTRSPRLSWLAACNLPNWMFIGLSGNTSGVFMLSDGVVTVSGGSSTWAIGVTGLSASGGNYDLDLWVINVPVSTPSRLNSQTVVGTIDNASLFRFDMLLDYAGNRIITWVNDESPVFTPITWASLASPGTNYAESVAYACKGSASAPPEITTFKLSSYNVEA